MPFLITRISQIYIERQARLEALQNDSQPTSSVLPSAPSTAHTVDGSRNNSHSPKRISTISRIQKIYADRQARLKTLQIQSRQPDTVSEQSPSISNLKPTTVESYRAFTGSTTVLREVSQTQTTSDSEPSSITQNTEPTRVIVPESSPETEFEPANKHRHFGILHYIVNNRFHNTNCRPKEKSTLLYAYSNDLTAEQVLNTWGTLCSSLREKSYNTFAQTRFDTVMYNYMTWRRNANGFCNSLMTNLPNETEAFPNPKKGSDIFQVLKYFFESEVEHCGATIFVLMKRLPSDTDISVLVSTLQKYHAQITIVTSETPLGGSYQDSIYKLASETNGICLFAEDDRFRDTPTWLPSIWPLYLVYSFNAEVTKSGNVTLPPFNSTLAGDHHICMTLQNYGPLDTFRMVNLVLYNAGSLNSLSFEETVESHAAIYGNTTYIRKGPYTLDAVTYHMRLGFEYSESKSNILQIRIYSVSAVDFWVPYAN